MKKKCNILFLGGAKRVSIAQHFKQYGVNSHIDVAVFSYELNRKVPIASEAEVIVGLKWSDDAIFEHLQGVIREKNIHVVLPFVDQAILIASKLKNICGEVWIPVSDENICNVMFDKVLAARWFSENNIPQPPSYGNRAEFEYPVILKPRKGSASKGIIIVRKESELPEDMVLEEYLVQKYIEDRTEYSVDCYLSGDKKIKSVVPRIRLEALGGEAVRSITVRDCRVIDAAKKILETHQFAGPVTIQFIQDNCSGQLAVMEINPRLGGGVVTSIGAGSEIISMIVKEAMGEPVEAVETWKNGTLMTRYFKEIIFYADNN